MRFLLAVTALALSTTAVAAQGHAVIALPDQLSWGPAPAVLPPGAKLAVVEGDPTAAGSYTMRLLMPDGYRIPPHFHPATEHVTVLEGTFKVGMGERFDASSMTPLPSGTFAALDPGVRHYAQAQGRTIIQLHGRGPWGLTYVNPADDPRKRTP